MVVSVTFSKPAKNVRAVLGREYVRVRIWRLATVRAGGTYAAEFLTQTQAFQKTLSEDECTAFIKEHAGTTFRNVVQRTETEEITTLTNRHGVARTFTRPCAPPVPGRMAGGERKKKYLLAPGTPLPFLVRLGVMTPEGAVIAQKQDKFRQINRFVEFVADVLPDIIPAGGGTLRVLDFGCGKSYLTFAVYHYLHDLRGLSVQVTGLDLKEDVISDCAALARECGYDALRFLAGDIATYRPESAEPPNLVIALHACDTATDHALSYAVHHGARAVLCAPCCQHELNAQLQRGKGSIGGGNPFATLTRHGIIRERLAALATDALRAELLEQHGYAVQVLEFIDMEHTPKNLLLRAVKKQDGSPATASRERTEALLSALPVSPTLRALLAD